MIVVVLLSPSSSQVVTLLPLATCWRVEHEIILLATFGETSRAAERSSPLHFGLCCVLVSSFFCFSSFSVLCAKISMKSIC